MDQIKIVGKVPTAEEYNELRRSVGWRTIDKNAVEIGLNNSIYISCAETNGKVVGIGRIVGDKGIVCYLQDLMVMPEYQKQGIGTKLMNQMMSFLKENCIENTFIGLMSGKGKENIYERYGFIKRPNEHYGAGMYQHLKL